MDASNFLHLLEITNSVSIPHEQMKVIVLISGYSCFKLRSVLKCEECQSKFITQRILEVDTGDIFGTLNSMDRGGLTWPTDFAVGVATEVCKIFQIILEDKRAEGNFLKISNQRAVLTELSEVKLTELDFLHGECDSCDSPVRILVKKYIKPLINILLNNYSKTCSDKRSEKNSKRKMQTFNKRL